ncbi:MAG: hypothetical protein JHC87_00420 [Thermoleophilaceae bacterium]|nr:hypothetical protein [Thermoleophilaceae bacterium]
MRFITSKIVVVAVAAAMATAGLAVAQGGGNGGGNSNQGQGNNQQQGPGGPGGPGGHRGGPGGPPAFMRGLTNATINSQRNGKAVVIRLDAGKVKTVGTDSVTITENDGTDVDIAVDADTEIHVPGYEDAQVDDLEVGQQVMAEGKQGKAAHSIGVKPPKPPAQNNAGN